MLDSTRLADDADRSGQAAANHDAARPTLRIPEPAARSGEPSDFSTVKLSNPGAVRRPELDAAPQSMHDVAYALCAEFIQRIGTVLEHPRALFIA